MKNLLRTLGAVVAVMGMGLAVPAVASAAPAANPASNLVNATYVAIQPCRIVDTRLAVGNIANLATRTYHVSGSTGFTAQGGKADGCGIPANAAGIAASLISIQPKTAGFVRAYPAGTPEPTATVLNYLPFSVVHGNAENSAILSVSSSGLTVKNYAGPTGLVIDVTGYFAVSLSTTISANADILTGGGGLLNIDNPSNGTYLITTSADVTGCTPTVSLLGNDLGNLLPLVSEASIADAHTVRVDLGVLNLLNLGIHLGGTNAPFALNVTC